MWQFSLLDLGLFGSKIQRQYTPVVIYFVNHEISLPKCTCTDKVKILLLESYTLLLCPCREVVSSDKNVWT